jgi:hypothetical protein
MERHLARIRERQLETVDRWTRIAKLANLVLPIGWLAAGVMSAAEGDVVPSLLGAGLMTLIGAGSLRWAYRSTLRLYQGEPSNTRALLRKGSAPAGRAPAAPRGLLLEARVPGLSEPVAAVALGSLRSLLRSPEAKMMMLSSGIMILVFGSMLLQGGGQSPEWSRPLAGVGAIMVVLFGFTNVMANQFGFDREGFRVFVLSPLRRRDVLLGKNLGLVPLIAAIVFVLMVILQVFRPMRADHLAAMPFQFVTMYLISCVVMNLLSIFAPVHVPSGSLRPANPTVSTVLLQLVTLMLLLPTIQGLTLLPLGTELLMGLLGEPPRLPLALLLTILQCTLVAALYLLCLRWQGRLLQEREQRILERVTAKTP